MLSEEAGASNPWDSRQSLEPELFPGIPGRAWNQNTSPGFQAESGTRILCNCGKAAFI